MVYGTHEHIDPASEAEDVLAASIDSLEVILDGLCRQLDPFPAFLGMTTIQAVEVEPALLQGRLCRRIERHIKELFVFVAEPDVPSDNNPAERACAMWLSAARSAAAPGRNVVPRAR